MRWNSRRDADERARDGSATLSVRLIARFATGRGTTLGGGYHAGQ
jgi:hypothetical protein